MREQHCGIPTLTCVFLILFMGALYVNASLPIREIPRLSSVQDVLARRTSRGRQGSIADSGPGFGDRIDIRRRAGGRRRIHGSRRGSGRRTNSRMGRRTLRRARRLANATTPFATRLLGELYPQVMYDTVFSPHSVHTVLTMAVLGARGRTERQLSNALGLRQVRLRGMRSHRAYQALLTSLQHTHRDVHVFAANAVFVKPNIPLELNFRRQLQILYLANFDSFKRSPLEPPETPINHWVSLQTRGNIQDLLPQGSIGNDTAMVLVNTLYLNASWAQPFNVRATRPADFYSLSQGTVEVDMMETTGMFRYANHHSTQVLELPYKGDRLAMYILLPDQNSNINDLLSLITGSSSSSSSSPSPSSPSPSPPSSPSSSEGVENQLETLLQGLRPTFTKISLPKFRIESDLLDVKAPLRRMGVRRAFDPNRANFTGISMTELHIDQIFHKAVIEVSEAGTLASAASAVYFGQRSSPLQHEKVMLVNRPFMFVIRDKTMNTILFMGTFLGQSRGETEGEGA